ncbi:MAG: hypothetical protein HFE73_10975 [Firmicutes bacterium]|nr:hypothetical protein [Bacillota bacterium]
MRNQRPIFTLSMPLIVENLKMYWYLPVLSFLIYFSTGIFPILTRQAEKRVGYYETAEGLVPVRTYLQDCLQNWNFAFFMLMLLAPLVAAVLMMGFLHKPAKAMTLHSQPFSRNKIFCSHILTGWLMCILPVIVMTGCYLPFSGKIFLDEDGSYLAESTGDGMMMIFRWCFTSLAIVTFLYGMYVLAGSLVGTSVMQVLLSGVFFIIAPLLVLITISYCESFLSGFSQTPEGFMNFMDNANPLLHIAFNPRDTISMGLLLGYLASGIVMIVLAGIAYEKAKLERVGDSMMYRIFEEIITWLVVFVGMSMFGFLFLRNGQGKLMMLIGMAVGTILTFIIVKIILARSIKIFTKANVRSFLLFVVIAALFSAVTVFDALGYTDRLPKKSDVLSVSRQGMEIGRNEGFQYYSLSDTHDELTSEETIERVLALHQYIVENQLYLDNEGGGVAIYDYAEGGMAVLGNLYIQFEYTMADGSTMERYFTIAPDEKAMELLYSILNSEEYREKGALSTNIDLTDVSYITLYINDTEFEYYEDEKTGIADTQSSQITLSVDDPEKMKELLAALEKDYYNRNYGTVNETTPFNGLEVNGELNLRDNDNTYDSTFVSFHIYPTDKESVPILKQICIEKGYEDYAKRLEK